MIRHFPHPYPGELLQSTFARLAARTAPNESGVRKMKSFLHPLPDETITSFLYRCSG
jgi:hypothetical protein